MMIASDAISICELRHRMAFIAEDIDTQKRCSIVRIMPFLHERRLYFDQDTPGRYLMASMQLDTKSRTKYNSSTCQCLTGATEALTYSDKFAVKKVTAICRMDLDKDTYNVYAPNGLLLKRINYASARAQYGTPVA
jgi:hypothetical protein